MSTLTRRYTDEAIGFIKRSKDKPFFAYIAHTMPHTLLAVSDQFKGRSAGGFYGDVIEEIDWSVGQVLDTLRDLHIDENTLVFFSSDNGPWLIFDDHGGSAGLFSRLHRRGQETAWADRLAWHPLGGGA